MIPHPLATFVFTLLAGGAAQLVASWLSLPSIRAAARVRRERGERRQPRLEVLYLVRRA